MFQDRDSDLDFIDVRGESVRGPTTKMFEVIGHLLMRDRGYSRYQSIGTELSTMDREQPTSLTPCLARSNGRGTWVVKKW